MCDLFNNDKPIYENCTVEEFIYFDDNFQHAALFKIMKIFIMKRIH